MLEMPISIFESSFKITFSGSILWVRTGSSHTSPRIPIPFWTSDFFSIMKIWPILQVVMNRERKCSPLSYISDFSQLYKTFQMLSPEDFSLQTKPRVDPSGNMAAFTSHQDKPRTFTAPDCHSGTGLARGYAQPRLCLGKLWFLTWTTRSSLHWKVEEKPSSSLAWLYKKKKINTRAVHA